MFSVDEVIYNMHHFEEENFERFDELYDDVRSGNFTAEKDAVKRLCRTFETEFGQIHPHQYHKAVSMTFMIADRMGIEEGFRQLAEGLCGLGEDKGSYVYEYISMLFYSYQKADLEIFRENLDRQEQNENVWKQIKKLCAQDNERLRAAKEVFGTKER